MSHPIDVGSVLGGRYKVTATVLASHDQDLVLDGVDQVLNRPVSILVAGPDNADQVAQSAREVATGERPGSVQILDLGVSDATTYLITNHTSAADLLDLVVSSNPPYVEPFFTDTLGSEIFGQARSHEPETYEGLYDDEEVDAGYINYGQSQPVAGQRPASPTVPPAGVPSRPASAPSGGSSSNGSANGSSNGASNGASKGAGAGAAAGAAAAGAAAVGGKAAKAPTTAPQETAAHTTAPHPVQEGTAGSQAEQAASLPPTAAAPKVSLWADDDYSGADQRDGGDHHGSAVADGAAGAGFDTADRAPGNFPASARSAVDEGDYDEYEEYENDAGPRREPRSRRWLVGGLLAAVLVVGLLLAVTNLGSLFKSGPQANPGTASSSPSSAPEQSSAQPSATASPEPAAGPPAIEDVTRLGNFDFAGNYDSDLVKTFDGNGASFWSDMEFATDNWGGLASEVPLAVKLKDPSKVSSVTLSQLGASGGSISVYTNDRPSLDGAKQVGTNSFTSPDLTMPLSEPVTAQYVIVSIKTLPKLAAPKTRYGYGLRLAEIKVQ